MLTIALLQRARKNSTENRDAEICPWSSPRPTFSLCFSLHPFLSFVFSTFVHLFLLCHFYQLFISFVYYMSCMEQYNTTPSPINMYIFNTQKLTHRLDLHEGETILISSKQTGCVACLHENREQTIYVWLFIYQFCQVAKTITFLVGQYNSGC